MLCPRRCVRKRAPLLALVLTLLVLLGVISLFVVSSNGDAAKGAMVVWLSDTAPLTSTHTPLFDRAHPDSNPGPHGNSLWGDGAATQETLVAAEAKVHCHPQSSTVLGRGASSASGLFV